MPDFAYLGLALVAIFLIPFILAIITVSLRPRSDDDDYSHTEALMSGNVVTFRDVTKQSGRISFWFFIYIILEGMLLFLVFTGISKYREETARLPTLQESRALQEKGLIEHRKLAPGWCFSEPTLRYCTNPSDVVTAINTSAFAGCGYIQQYSLMRSIFGTDTPCWISKVDGQNANLLGSQWAEFKVKFIALQARALSARSVDEKEAVYADLKPFVTVIAKLMSAKLVAQFDDLYWKNRYLSPADEKSTRDEMMLYYKETGMLPHDYLYDKFGSSKLASLPTVNFECAKQLHLYPYFRGSKYTDKC